MFAGVTKSKSTKTVEERQVLNLKLLYSGMVVAISGEYKSLLDSSVIFLDKGNIAPKKDNKSHLYILVK